MSVYYVILNKSAPDAIVTCDPEGRIVDLNKRCLQIFGYERHELIGEKVEKLIPSRFRDSHAEHRDRYVAAPSSRDGNDQI